MTNDDSPGNRFRRMNNFQVSGKTESRDIGVDRIPWPMRSAVGCGLTAENTILREVQI